MKRNAIDEFVNVPKRRIEQEDLPPPPPGISFDEPEQRDAIEKAIRGESFLVTAGAGYGKSTLVDYIVRVLKEIHGADAVATTASTGVAALRGCLGSRTIHSFGGFQIGVSAATGEVLQPVQAVAKVSDIAKARWEDTKVLVVDEISMLPESYFTLFEQVARIIRKSGPVFFGGLQMIFVGDFFQLPPVKGNFVFQSAIWGPAIGRRGTILLKKPYRQSDEEFLHMLESIKLGNLDAAAHATLEKCAVPFHKREGNDPDKTVVHLLARRETVNAINKRALESLQKPLATFRGTFSGRESYRNNLKNLLVDDELQLCEGCRVMLVANLDVASGYANGSTGKVVAFNGRTPMVKWDTNGHTSSVVPYVWTFTDDNGVERAQYSHLPLINANATTIHKSQGLTIPRVCADLGNVRSLEMAYVALSRTRDMKDLMVAGLRRIKWNEMKVDARVAEWFNKIKNN